MNYAELAKYLAKSKKLKEQEKELEQLLGPRQYKVVEVEPRTCTACNGKGSYYMEGDLHKSGGVVPCQAIYCSGGIVRYERVEVKRRVRVKAISQKRD